MNSSPFIFERIKLEGLLDPIISPGSFNGNRVAVRNSLDDIVVASDKTLYHVRPNLVNEEDIPQITENESIPIHLSSCTMQAIQSHDIQHKDEICNITYKNDASSHSGVLYSIDMKGHVLSHVQGHEGSTSHHLIAPTNKMENQLWCGVDVSPSDPSKLITAYHLDKKVTLYDNGKVVRSIQTILNPTQVRFVDENVIALTENNTLTFMDLRQKERFGTLKRVQPYSGPLYAMHVLGDLVGVGGFNRSLAVFDKRKMSVLAHWSSSLKYEITRFLFSSMDPKLCYVSGLDSEILCGRWDGSSNLSHFDGPRVESRWIGMTHHEETDTIVGYTEHGYCYILRNGVKLLEMSKNK